MIIYLMRLSGCFLYHLLVTFVTISLHVYDNILLRM